MDEGLRIFVRQLSEIDASMERYEQVMRDAANAVDRLNIAIAELEGKLNDLEGRVYDLEK